MHVVCYWVHNRYTYSLINDYSTVSEAVLVAAGHGLEIIFNLGPETSIYPLCSQRGGGGGGQEKLERGGNATETI